MSLSRPLQIEEIKSKIQEVETKSLTMLSTIKNLQGIHTQITACGKEFLSTRSSGQDFKLLKQRWIDASKDIPLVLASLNELTSSLSAIQASFNQIATNGFTSEDENNNLKTLLTQFQNLQVGIQGAAQTIKSNAGIAKIIQQIESPSSNIHNFYQSSAATITNLSQRTSSPTVPVRGKTASNSG